MGNAIFAFLPVIIFFSFFALIVGIFLFILIIGIKRTKGDEWSGVVVDKIYGAKEKERKGNTIWEKRNLYIGDKNRCWND